MKKYTIVVFYSLALISVGANASYVSGKYARGVQSGSYARGVRSDNVITKDGKIVGSVDTIIKVYKPEHEQLIAFIDQNKNNFKKLTTAEVIKQLPQLSSFKGALETTALLGSLNKAVQTTVFAPVNSAFDEISSVVSGLTPGQISQILNYHIIPNKALKDKDLEKVARGTAVAITAAQSEFDAGKVTPQVIIANIPTKNGIIHLIDKVQIPEQGEAIAQPTVDEQ